MREHRRGCGKRPDRPLSFQYQGCLVQLIDVDAVFTFAEGNRFLFPVKHILSLISQSSMQLNLRTFILCPLSLPLIISVSLIIICINQSIGFI
uniref:Uncharacterized protein n=1 Tax=Rhizophora mucronata TaxID=61149 RepID=A0A2P2QE95_RHIMU